MAFTFHDYEDDSYEYIRNDEGEFLAEVGIMDRSEMVQRDTLESIAERAGIVPELRTKYRSFVDKRWRFLVYAEMAISKYSIYGLDRNDRLTILTKALETPNMAYKNPVAFIFGYMITKKKVIEKVILKLMIDRLKDINGEKSPILKPTDLMRYSRLWLSLY